MGKPVRGSTARLAGLDHLTLQPSRQAETWARRVGRLGLASRGGVFTVIGVFLSVAAWTADPHQARGLSGALQTSEQQPYGPWVLGVVALGLVAYGVYILLLARYRRILI